MRGRAAPDRPSGASDRPPGVAGRPGPGARSASGRASAEIARRRRTGSARWRCQPRTQKRGSRSAGAARLDTGERGWHPCEPSAPPSGLKEFRQTYQSAMPGTLGHVLLSGRMASVISVNLARVRVPGWKQAVGRTGIDKRPTAHRVRLANDQVEGDAVCDVEHHGGYDQAVYAYATEDAAWWAG